MSTPLYMKSAGEAMNAMSKRRKDVESAIEKAREKEITTSEELAAAQQEQQQLQATQEEDQQKMEQQQQQDAAKSVFKAAITPSYKPFEIQPIKAATVKVAGPRVPKAVSSGITSRLQALMGTRKAESLVPLLSALGVGVGADAMSYGTQRPEGTGYWSDLVHDLPRNFPRAFGMSVALASGATGGHIGRKNFVSSKNPVIDASKDYLKWGAGIPAAERLAAQYIFGTQPLMNKKLMGENEIIRRKLNGTYFEPGSGGAKTEGSKIPWGPIAALAAIPTGIYAYDKIFNAKKDREKVPTIASGSNSGRVSLEIPQEKISDKFYNRLGREILFQDEKEEERRQQNQLKVATATELKPPPPMPAPTANVDPTKYDGKQKLTPMDVVGSEMSAPGMSAWFKQYNKPSGMWNAVETYAPFVSGLLGGPRVGTLSSRLTSGMRPLTSGPSNLANNRWGSSMRQFLDGPPEPQLMPGQVLNPYTAG